MQNFSTTQATNYLAFSGVLVMILGYFGVNITNEEAVVFIGAVVALVGIISNFVHRYKKGDVKASGVIK